MTLIKEPDLGTPAVAGGQHGVADFDPALRSRRRMEGDMPNQRSKRIVA